MPEWKNEECSSLIAARYGEEAAKTARPMILSVQWKIALAGYHANESKSLLEPFTGSIVDMMRHLYGTTGDYGSLSIAAEKSEAHLIACAAALHSLADIMAHVVFIATGLPSNSIDEGRRGLHSVASELKKANLASPVLRSLENLRWSKSFKYIQAYANTTKHRSLVSVQPSIHFGSPRKQGFKVMEFKYKGSVLPSTWFDTVADDYRVSVGTFIVEIGNALNEWLKSLASVP